MKSGEVRTSAAGLHWNRNVEQTDVENEERPKKAWVGAYSKDVPAVTIFENANCEGKSERLYHNPDKTVVGAEYRTEQLFKSNMDQKFETTGSIKVKSVRVPPGLFFYAYQKD